MNPLGFFLRQTRTDSVSPFRFVPGVGKQVFRKTFENFAIRFQFLCQTFEQRLGREIGRGDRRFEISDIRAGIPGQEFFQKCFTQPFSSLGWVDGHLPYKDSIFACLRQKCGDKADDFSLALCNNAGLGEKLAQHEVTVRRIEIQHAGFFNQLPYFGSIFHLWLTEPDNPSDGPVHTDRRL